MRTYLLFTLFGMALMLLPELNYSQTPNLGTTENFAVFTAVGAFNNDGSTVVIGDIGTDVGAFNGFPPGIVIGNIYVADPATAQAATDVDILYSYLDNLLCGVVLGVNLGNNQVLGPNIYCIGAAAVLDGNLTLDGEGDPNARFIFQIDGALSTATLASITLANGASICNVYWQINGAFDLGESAAFAGTLVVNGSISLLEASSLEGRALSRGGAIDLHNNNVTLPLAPLPTFITADGDLSFCDGGSVVLSGNGDGIWNTGEMTYSITVFVSGNYFVINTNDCGIAISNSISVVVLQDSLPPVITCPFDISVNCNESVLPTDTGFATAIDDCDLNPVIAYSDLTIPGICLFNEDIIRTWVVTDIAGNSTFCIQTISISDLFAPVITCPGDMTLECTDPVIPGTTGMATATDNCTLNPAVNYIDIILPGQCTEAYEIIRTWTATDDCDHTSTCEQHIDVMDSTLPSIVCPLPVTVDCADNISPLTVGTPTATDNCGVAVVSLQSESITDQTCENRFILTRVYLATDGCSNTSTCMKIITVSDVVPPPITFIDPLLPGATDGDTVEIQCYGQDPQWDLPTFSTNSVQANDACSGEVSITYTKTLLKEGNCTEDGYINLYRLDWTATDICGNSSSVYLFLKLVDNIPPVMQGIPDDITLNCDALIQLEVSVTTLDECLCACVVVSDQSAPQAGCQDGMVMTITWTATDQCGNVTTEEQYVTLVDTIGPTIMVVHPDIAGILNGTILEVQCNEDGFPRFVQEMDIKSVSSTSECGGDSPLVILETAITEYADCAQSGFLEERTFLWTVTDLCGNSSTFSFSVRMIDTIPPVWVGVPDTVCVGSPLLAAIEAKDNCDYPYTQITDTAISNPCGSGMAIRRKFKATDECGNQAVASVIIIPSDLTVPIIHFTNLELIDMLPGESILAQCNASNGQYTSFGVDDIDVEGVCTALASKTFSEKVIEIHDCTVDGIKAVVALTWTVTDVCGNSASRSIIATIVDNQPPVFDPFISEQTIGCADTLPLVHATDNCGNVTMTYQDTILPTGCVYEYTIMRLVTASDDCGNSTSQEQIIHVGSGTGPVFSTIEDVYCDTTDVPVVTAYDPCAESFINVTMTADTLDTLCNEGLVILRTWTAVDICGNESVLTQTIIIHDHTSPVLLVPGQSFLFPFWNHPKSIVYLWQFELLKKLNALDEFSVVIYDDCDQYIRKEFSKEVILSENCITDGYYERWIFTWIATDICGNADTLRVTIDVVDDIPPVFLDFPYDITIYCQPLPEVPVLTVFDYAESVSIVYSESIMPGSAQGVFLVKRTWIATDMCGNNTQQVQTITWVPDNNLACEIILPDIVTCNSHGVLIHSVIAGGSGIQSYQWEVEGEECFIQSGQGSPWIKIYVGWIPVKVTLTVTDSTGCVSMCMTTLYCFAGQMKLDGEEHTGADHEVFDPNQLQNFQPTGESVDITDMLVWPNPASDEVNLSFMTNGEVEYRVNIINMLNQTVIGNKMISMTGLNTRRIDFMQLMDGNYTIQIVTPHDVYTKNLVILAR
ncbi:MAG: ice-binding family protein [Saprospiraceae bacterium]|nr:ice-binding family protein [Saprospiraceae bacterium]